MKPDTRPWVLIPIAATLFVLVSAAPVRLGPGGGLPSIADPGPSPTTGRVEPAAAEPTGRGTALEVAMAEAAFGRSGALRTQVVGPGQALRLELTWHALPINSIRYRWRPVLGTTGAGSGGRLGLKDVATAPTAPGVYELELESDGRQIEFGEKFRVVVNVPFERKRSGRIGPYRLGRWPTEGEGRTDEYAPPAGFIEVTEANQSLPLSENFTLGQFLTKDQESVWPKYVVVDPKPVDKLELVLLELRAMGIRADRMVVMSGFRTPHYNQRHLGNSPSSLSRHLFGDAADVWVENGADRSMSDLNGDGRRNVNDARVILRAVDRVERRHPDLVGGAGVYRANNVRGPFIHIDVRGRRARW